MRRTFLPLLLAAALVIPLAAHADTVDDFLYTGPTSTISFSLPASPPNAVPHVGAGMSDAGFSVPATINFNGTVYDAGVQFLTDFSGPGAGAALYLTNDYNVPLISDILYTGASATPTFKTGTFGAYSFDAPDLDYTLTITPESAPPSAVPEPRTLAFVGTGLVGLFAFAIRRKPFAPMAQA